MYPTAEEPYPTAEEPYPHRVINRIASGRFWEGVITDSSCLVIVAIYANGSIESKLVQSFWSETKDWLDEISEQRRKF